MTRNELFLKRLALEDDKDFAINDAKQAEHAQIYAEIQRLDAEASKDAE